MFEQIKSKNGGSVEDIFSTTEEKPLASLDRGAPINQNIPSSAPQPVTPAAPLINQHVGPAQPLTNLKEIQMEPEKKKSAFLPVLIIIILVIALGGLGYLAYGKFFGNNQNANLPVNENIVENQNINQPVTNQDLNANQPVNENVNENIIIDSDHDGLTDDEEKALGTNINEVDTDGDNLYDFEEVRTYQTNSLNPDTDSDGYLDGEEVRGGYNPKGPGKMLNLP